MLSTEETEGNRLSENDTEAIIDILVEETEHSRDDIKKMIRDTIADLDNLIDENGAVLMVANNLNVNINQVNEKTIQIQDLTDGSSNLTILGRVSKIFPTNTFTRKDGNEGRVRNIELIDDTGEVRVALWDTKGAEIDMKDIEVGDIVRISGANARKGYQDRMELSVGSQSALDKITDNSVEEKFPEIQAAAMVSMENLASVDDGKEVSVKGKIVDKRDKVTTFSRKDGSQGKVTSITLADTTGKARLTFWDDATEKAEKTDMGTKLQVNNVRVGSSDYGKELTFNTYSTMKQIDDPTLDEVEQGSSRVSNELDSLKEINDGDKGISVKGQIISIGQKNSFQRDGETRYVGNLTIRDHSSQRRVTLWGDHATKMDSYKVGSVVKLENVSARLNDYSNEVEISVGDYSTITDITDNVDLEKYEKEAEFVTLSEVTETRRGVAIKVRINRFFDINTINKDDGSTSEVLNAGISDSEGTQGRIAAWNDDIQKLNQFNEGDALVLKNVRITPAGEYQASITINQMTIMEETEMEEIIPAFQSASAIQNDPNSYQKSSLDKTVIGTQVEVRGTVVAAYSPNFYPSCSQCRKKVDMENEMAEVGTCPTHGEVQVRTRMILTLALDDNTDTTNIKIFDNVAEELIGMTAAEAKAKIEDLSAAKAPVQGLEMQEFIVKGKVLEDTYGDTPKKVINVDSIEPLDLSKQSDALLDSLE